MPLFGSSKFSPKKFPPRKWSSLSNLNTDADVQQKEFGVEYGPIKINLGSNEVTFENGQWISETGGAASVHREMAKMKKENQQLIEENNLLKLKIEILLDLLSDTTAEVSLKENEIQELKEMAKSRRR